jgi:hypothetical protein
VLRAKTKKQVMKGLSEDGGPGEWVDHAGQEVSWETLTEESHRERKVTISLGFAKLALESGMGRGAGGGSCYHHPGRGGSGGLGRGEGSREDI